MTGPSSYLFYDTRNLLKARVEHTRLDRVFITPTKVTLYSKLLTRTAKSGVLYEKVIAQTTFSLHENKNGTKYIKRFTKSLGGAITDTSLSPFITRRLFDERPVSSECQGLIEKTIREWFGPSYRGMSIEEVKSQLLFPALRMMNVLPDTFLLTTLSEMQADYGIITKALRENDSWLAFLMDVCKPTTTTLQELDCITKHPNELLPIAIMDWGVSLSSLFAENSTILLHMRESFTSVDLKFIHFMLKNIPPSKRPDVVGTILNLVWAQIQRKNLRVAGQHQFVYFNSDIGLTRIPAKLRPKLAAELLKSLKETYEEVLKQTTVAHVAISTELSNVFRYWFAQIVFEPSVQTSLTAHDVESRFHELLGTPLRSRRSPIKFIKKNGLEFCIVSADEVKEKNKDAFTRVKYLVKKLPQIKGSGASYHWLNGYVAIDGSFMMSQGELYSLDDIMKITEDGVAVIDKCLTKLGRALTPENRLAFVTFEHKDRKFKNTWQLYDWGVTDPSRVIALKKAKVVQKDEVKMYNELPDEMFYELLHLASGKENPSTLGNEAWLV